MGSFKEFYLNEQASSYQTKLAKSLGLKHVGNGIYSKDGVNYKYDVSRFIKTSESKQTDPSDWTIKEIENEVLKESLEESKGWKYDHQPGGYRVFNGDKILLTKQDYLRASLIANLLNSDLPETRDWIIAKDDLQGTRFRLLNKNDGKEWMGNFTKKEIDILKPYLKKVHYFKESQV